METSPITVNLTRRLLVRDATGEHEAWLRIFDCRFEGEGADWSVRLQVVGLPSLDEKARTFYGVDGLQAVLGSVRIAKAMLESSAEFRQGRLRWDCADPGSEIQDLGLPDFTL